ncbi:hypothetical protein [Mesorhizobium sp. L-8-3]|uniref:hypothetical protein n=1 Tax=Mesorhizobium sp. L-8-3 TaxID=2744522 RepID=UPI001928F8AA|nr:hypothetical protein [Mesorhizobium sp. L-8-3]BCH27963.1 hypothetical protein MesoLjLb_77480 [Mesorhizobium sp. L-8-3]
MEILIPILVAIISSILAYIASERSLRHQIDSFEKKIRRDYQLEFATEAAARKLLLSPDWSLRSFGEIKKRLHGLDDDEVRKVLIRSGALCFRGTDDQELWGLIERNADRLK